MDEDNGSLSRWKSKEKGTLMLIQTSHLREGLYPLPTPEITTAKNAMTGQIGEPLNIEWNKHLGHISINRI